MPDTLPPIADQTTRDRIGPWSNDRVPALDAFAPDTNFAVCAAAGSGKTTALVGRMLGLVRTGVPVDAIAAITFTRKAAGELRLRFYRELQELQDRHEQQGGLTEKEQDRVAQALQDLPACEIATIHAFAGKILRENPEAVGVSTGFTEGIEDSERDALAERFWQRYLYQQFDEAPEQLANLEDLGVDLSDLRTFFCDIVKEGSVKPYVDGPKAPVDLTEAVEAAHELIDTWLPRALPAAEMKKGKTEDNTEKWLRQADRMRKVRSLETTANQVAFLSFINRLVKSDGETRNFTLKNWQGESDDKKHWRDVGLPDFVMTRIRPNLVGVKAHIYRQIVEFVYPAVEAFKKERYATGQLTHTDVLHAARDLLRDDTDLRNRLQQDIRVVLVDEFQDTDPVQAELVFFLTGKHTDERDWRKTAPRPGSLFIVGDDKQSIYGFRGADMAVFDDVARLIDAQSHGERVDLTTNFRSVPGICDWVNTTFEQIFTDDPEEHQATYEPLRARPNAPVHQPAVTHHVIPYISAGRGGASARQVAEPDAQTIADYIEAAINQDGPLLTSETGEVLAAGKAGDFMILTRNTQQLDLYAEALSVRGIPYTLTGGKDAGQSEAVRGLVALLSCVLRTDDPVARVAYLRGPLVGLSDDALYALRKAFDATDETWADPFTSGTELPDAVRPHLDEDTATRYTQACALIDRATALVSSHRPSIALQRLIDEAGLMARALTERPEASLNAGRLRRVLAKVQTMEQEGRAWHEVRDYLHALATGEETLDGMTLQEGTGGAEGEGANAVRVMNVHQAKGLQANVVFLADPTGWKKKPSTKYADKTRDALVLPVAVDYGGHARSVKYAPECWATEAKDEAKAANQSEHHRLQYVAATRAKHLLVVSRYFKSDNTDASGSWQELALRIAADDVPALDEHWPTPAPGSKPSSVSDHDWIGEGPPTRSAALAITCTPSFATYRISEGDPDEPTNYDVLQKDGYGPAFGTAVHEMLELAVQYRAVTPNPAADTQLITLTLQQALGEDKVKQEKQDAAEQMVERFLKSDLWDRIRRARRVHTEVPVAAYIADASPDASPTLTRGVVDLLLQDPDGSWHLVDYKTNRLPDADTREELEAHYQHQLQGYADLLREQAGIAVATTGVWWGDA